MERINPVALQIDSKQKIIFIARAMNGAATLNCAATSPQNTRTLWHRDLSRWPISKSINLFFFPRDKSRGYIYNILKNVAPRFIAAIGIKILIPLYRQMDAATKNLVASRFIAMFCSKSLYLFFSRDESHGYNKSRGSNISLKCVAPRFIATIGLKNPYTSISAP